MNGFSDWLPGATILEIIQIFVLPIFTSTILVLIAIRLVPLFLHLAKLMKFGKYGVAIQKYEKRFNPSELVGRAFFASIFATAVALTFNNILFDFGVVFVEGSPQSYSTAAMTAFISPVSLVILVPTWALEDFGVVLYKKSNIADRDSSTYDVMSAGTFYGYLIKGFAGITTPVMYIYLFYRENLIGGFDIMIILLLFVPFAVIGQYALALATYRKIAPDLKQKFIEKSDLPFIEAQFSIVNAHENPPR